jgi:hypothetical protein
MIKLPIILASIIAAVPRYAQDVRVFSGSQEHVYGPGGQLVDSPELRAKNERARQMLSEKRFIGPAEQQSFSIQQSNPSQVPMLVEQRRGATSAAEELVEQQRLRAPKSAWSQ